VRSISQPSRRLAGAAKHTAIAAGLAAFVVARAAAGGTGAPSAAATPGSEQSTSLVVVVAPDGRRLHALECTSGRETASIPLPDAASLARVALAPHRPAVFVTIGEQLLRLPLPSLAPATREVLPFRATSLAASGGVDGIVLAAGAGDAPLSAREPTTLASLHEYRLDEGGRATVSSVVDRAPRSRFVVAFSDRDEVWEIAYGRDAPPVLRGLVHDYRMREAVELPGRFTPRAFAVKGATRALVAGSVPHEVLRIDTSGAIGVLNLDVRREIERPAAAVVPDPGRIAAWRGERSRGWLFADDDGTTLRVLDSAAWKFVEPIRVEAPVLSVAALDDGSVLLALGGDAGIALARVDVEARRARPVAGPAPAGRSPYRFVRGTGACIALLDAQQRWITGLRRGTRGAAPGRGS